MSQFPALTATPATPTGFANLGYSLLSGAAASITVSGIGATYKEFIVLAWLKPSNDTVGLRIRPNNDSGATYDHQGFYGNGASVTNTAGTAESGVIPNAGTNVDNGIGSFFRVNIYKNAAALEGMIHSLGAMQQTTPSIYTNQNATRWNDTTNLMSSIVFLAEAGDLAANTMVSLFGLTP